MQKSIDHHYYCIQRYGVHGHRISDINDWLLSLSHDDPLVGILSIKIEYKKQLAYNIRKR